MIEVDEAPPVQSTASIVQPAVQSDSHTTVQSGAVVTEKSHMFQINFYRKYFDLDTDEFILKLKNAINPLNKESTTIQHEEDSATELYGFIWITGSLIFLMFVSSTGSNILANWLHSSDKKYEYDFDLLTLSICLFYGYNIIIPLALYAFTTWGLKFPQGISLTRVISIYGYTNILWLPITVVNFLIVLLISSKKHHTMLNALEWTIVLFSGAVTGLSNISKISPVLERNTLDLYQSDLDTAKKVHRALVFSLAFAHLIFTIIVKISFFGILV